MEDIAKTNISVCNTTHGKMITLASVSSKRRVLNTLGEGKCGNVYMYVALLVAKQLLWFTHWHTICIYFM